MKNLVLALSFLTGIALASPLNAQSAADVVSAYSEAMGGKANWAKMKNMKAVVNVNFGGQFELEAVQQVEAPNKSRFDAAIQGKTIVEAFDGKTAWSINPFESGDKAVQKTPEESNESLENEFPDALMFYKERGHKIELLGQEDVEGAKCHKIKLVHAVTGGESHHFIDVENHALIMTRTFPKNGQMKGAVIDNVYSDYAEQNGLMIALSSVQKMNGEPFMTTTVKKVEFNVKIDKKFFDFPGGK